MRDFQHQGCGLELKFKAQIRGKPLIEILDLLSNVCTNSFIQISEKLIFTQVYADISRPYRLLFHCGFYDNLLVKLWSKFDTNIGAFHRLYIMNNPRNHEEILLVSLIVRAIAGEFYQGE